MIYEPSKEFRFDAAHTLNRTVAVEPSRRIRGHSHRVDAGACSVFGREDA